MRTIPVLVTALLFTAIPFAAPASAKDGCPAGMIKECKPTAYTPKKGEQPCRCVTDPSNQGSGNQGKAEIKKKNVPQAKKTKTPGAND